MNDQKYLISYRSDDGMGRVIYGCDICPDPMEWIADTQEYPETYILINALPITNEQAERYDGDLKGM